MKIKIYGADWCSDCINVKNFLHSKNIAFEYVIITDDESAVDFVERVNNGKRVIPTLEIDGEIYINPGINKLMKIIRE